MKYALDRRGIRTTATPGARAHCPVCKEIMIARCGEIKVWHWAHKDESACDRFFESETEWHLEWKEHIDEQRCEVLIRKKNSVHIADIVTTDGTVIELQHSPISADAIRERERFYGKMMWLFDAMPFVDNLEFFDRGDYCTFRWKYPSKSHWACEMPVFWHLGEVLVKKESSTETVRRWGGGWYEKPVFSESRLPEDDYLFEVKRLYQETPCRGWGVFWTRAEFMEEFLV